MEDDLSWEVQHVFTLVGDRSRLTGQAGARGDELPVAVSTSGILRMPVVPFDSRLGRRYCAGSSKVQ